ncbi:PQQ-binding-like beta-propeller repeat protein [Sphingobacterium sp. UT-1RO-CII-1]|uniref:outer membrane protein assembly factor BamB family protein n=1 Tax=Sphingobacterium sp. UT-1RO-CII-1 TaxID=2995225 RepID=UPI00227AE2CA|nr:PQQ-binding-like beta-propeller repeat protein [Sphingobacterium sp. UT-1RO-CII-1]MCY4778586.1 PQQ-binding-like beta-propeller repeat protein [Sphingobacterium sp. UT-1RO-CII-1]
MKNNLFKPCLFAFYVMLISCSKDDSSGAGNTPTFDNLGTNKSILTSSNGKVYRVNATDGKADMLFDFGKQNDVSGLDSDGTAVYTGDESNTINSINLSSKQLLWRKTFFKEESITASEVQTAVKDGICYTIGHSGIAVALKADGTPLWSRTLDPDFDGTRNSFYPTYLSVQDQYVIVGSSSTVFWGDERNKVHLLDKATGKSIQTFSLPAETAVTGRVKISGGKLLVPMNDLVALELSSGKELWRLAMPDASLGAGTPTVAGGKVLLHGSRTVGMGGKLFCLDINNGQVLWEVDSGGDMVWYYTPTVIDNRYVLGVYEEGSTVNADGRPYLVRLEDGAKVWQNDNIGLDASATYANGHLYAYGNNLLGQGESVGLMALNAANGTLEWLNADLNGISNADPVILADNGIFKSPSAPDK